MKKIVIILVLSAICILPAGYLIKKLDFRDARLNNVCKDLSGEALLYFVFVDNTQASPWTEFDMQSTIDSIRIAIDWLHAQARKEKIELNIKADFYIGKEFTTIRKNLPEKSIYESVTTPNLKKGFETMNKWADGIAKVVGGALPIHKKDGLPEIKNPRNKERLVAYLRDENNAESVALFFMFNNYYKQDVSVPLNIFNTDDVEFAIVSYKYPSEIAHNFLHLYGAADLHETIYRKHSGKIKILQQEFPDDIMQYPTGRNIWELEIGSYTRYLIGWTDSYDPKHESLFTDKYVNY
jgi:hypothetical protein